MKGIETPKAESGRTGWTERTGGWTRRRALAALAVAASVPALPAAASPRLPAALSATPQPTLPPALAAICVAATESPAAARTGAAAAEGRTLPGLAASLLARLGPGTEADWRGALVASGRRDLAAGDAVAVLGQPLMRTEAEALALGVLLRNGLRLA